MARFLAGAAACFLMMTGAFLLWQGRAVQSAQLPAPAPPPETETRAPIAPQVAKAPEATPKTREEKRFARADKNDDGLIQPEELLTPRRKAYAKLDKNGDGRLSFEEWAVKTIDKFNTADRDRSRTLTPREFATTASKPAKRKTCAC